MRILLGCWLGAAVVLAGLGCPHGCEFCATSHYHGRKHIPLLKTGEDIYREIRRVHKTLGSTKLPIGIIEEDWLEVHSVKGRRPGFLPRQDAKPEQREHAQR